MIHRLWLPTRTPTQNNCLELKPLSKAKPSEQKVHFSQALALIWAWHLFSIQKRHINLYFGGLPIPLSKSVGFCQFSHWKIRPFLEKWLGTIFDTQKLELSDAFFSVFQRKLSNFLTSFLVKFLFLTYQKISVTIPSSFQYLFHLFPKSKLSQTLWF